MKFWLSIVGAISLFVHVTVGYSNTMPPQIPVVIVGGGLTGLITAYKLNKAHIPFLLLEADNRLGGRVNTYYYPDGATAEAHMEEYWQRTPNYALLKELKVPITEECPYPSMIINKKIYPRMGKCDHEYFAAIFTPLEYQAFQKWSDHTWAIETKIATLKRYQKPIPTTLIPLTKISFSAYVKSFHLPAKVNEWIRIILEPEISVDWDKISALDGIDEIRLFIGPPQGYGEKSYHVVGGNNNYIYALRDSLPKKSIQLQARVNKIVQTRDQVQISYTIRSKSYTVKSLYAVVTVPLFSLSHVQFRPGLPQDKVRAIASMDFAAYIKINYRLKYQANELWKKYGKDGLFTLISDQVIGTIYKSSSKKALSSQSNLVMTVLIYGPQAKAWSKFSSQQILTQATKRLEQLFPSFANYITDAKVYVYPTAIAYWPLSQHRSRFDELALKLRRPYQRVLIGGDTTEDSHSEGAARAALRMSNFLIEKLSNKQH